MCRSLFPARHQLAAADIRMCPPLEQVNVCSTRSVGAVAVTQPDHRIAAFSSLAAPTRRRLYLFVVSRPVGAGRDEAAKAVGISRGLAAFHLDRLIADGLLVAEYRRLTGRTGPGAGRPAKIYRRSARDLSFSVPQRNHELLARLFARAFSSTEGNPLE